MVKAILHPRLDYIPKLPSAVNQLSLLQAFFPLPHVSPEQERLNLFHFTRQASLQTSLCVPCSAEDIASASCSTEDIFLPPCSTEDITLPPCSADITPLSCFAMVLRPLATQRKLLYPLASSGTLLLHLGSQRISLFCLALWTMLCPLPRVELRKLEAGLEQNSA